MTYHDPFDSQHAVFSETPTRAGLWEHKAGGFLCSLLVPLSVGLFWAFYILAASDSTSEDKVFGVFAAISLLWTLAAGVALVVALHDKNKSPESPLALAGIIVASIQIFFGVLLTPIYFAMWQQVPASPF